MNDTDIRTHEGVVQEAGHDMSLSVLVESVSDVPIADVRPECVTPMRWRPAEGTKVKVYQRMGSLHQDTAFTWGGLAADIEGDDVVPVYMEAGRVFFVGEDGVLVMSLEDDADLIALPDGTDSATSIARYGREDADEPMMLGGVWRDQMRDILDELVDAAQATADAAGALSSTATTLGSAAWPVPAAGLLDSHGAPCQGAGVAAPSGPDQGLFNLAAGNATAAQAAALAVITAIATPTTGLKDLLDAAYSTYAFTSRDPPRQT